MLLAPRSTGERARENSAIRGYRLVTARQVNEFRDEDGRKVWFNGVVGKTRGSRGNAFIKSFRVKKAA
jgi:hypothetical protein